MAGYARELTREQEGRLSVWRSIAVKRMRPLRKLAYTCRYVAVPGLPGIGVADDKMRIYLDPDEWAERGWTDDECAEALLFLLHQALFEHHALAKKRLAEDGTIRPDLWNLASEAAVNSVLDEAKVHFPATMTTTPDSMGSPKGLSVDDYYADLVSRSRAAGLDLDEMGDEFNGPEGDSLHIFGDLVADGLLADGTPYNWSFVEREIADLEALVPPVPNFEIVSTIKHVAEEIVKSSGSGAGHLMRWAQIVNEPTLIPWTTIVGAEIRATAQRKSGGSVSSYSTRNRRRPFIRLGLRKAILPGRIRFSPVLVVVRDSSGSVKDRELGEMVKVIEELAEQAGIEQGNLHVLDADDSIYDPLTFTGRDSIRAATGGGGTDMRVPLEAIGTMFKRPPDLVIVCSDGGTPWPMTPPNFPTIAVITSSGKDTTPSWLPSYSVRGIAA